MTNVILFNGPPKSGKDTLGNWVREFYGESVRHMKIAASLKNMTHELYGLHGIDTLYYDAHKDEPRVEFAGLTPRQAYIKVSEELVKPVYGADWFGKVAARAMHRHSKWTRHELWVVTDSGFIEETTPIIEAFGAHHVMLVRLDQPGKNFAADSRNYLPLGTVPLTVDFHVEPGQHHSTRQSLRELVDAWYSGRFEGRNAPLEWPRVAEAHVQEPLP